MELFLNLMWVALAGLMLGLWVRYPQKSTRRHGAQMIALAMVVFFLFPVISVTDDLQAAQAPAEVDCSLRKADRSTPPPSLALTHVALCVPAVSGLPIATVERLSLSIASSVAPTQMLAFSIQNRPPPVA